MTSHAERDSRPTIFDLPPQEVGGIVSRVGFAFQDHVATSLCLEMLTEEKLAAVWCEAEDDVVLIWLHGGSVQVEFIQVKGGEPQPWTIAALTSRSGGKVGTSIVEHSLAHDRCREECRFRIVTNRGLSKELRPLAEPIGNRADAEKGMLLQFEERVGDFRSQNGNGCGYWIARVRIEVVGDSKAVEMAGILRLINFGEGRGFFFALDQWREIYVKVVALVQQASLADPHSQKEQKKIIREVFTAWLVRQLEAMDASKGSAVGLKLATKMARAGLEDDAIEGARRLRRTFLQKRRDPGYMKLVDYERIQAELNLLLTIKLAKLDAGQIDQDGPTFHGSVLSDLIELAVRKGVEEPFIVGAMYESTDRCLFRFLRARA
jgi:hypothetical protein